MIRVAQQDRMVPWQKLANERQNVANTLARICVIMFVAIVALGANSFTVMSNSSQMCTNLMQAQSSISHYKASTLPTTPIIHSYCR